MNCYRTFLLNQINSIVFDFETYAETIVFSFLFLFRFLFSLWTNNWRISTFRFNCVALLVSFLLLIQSNLFIEYFIQLFCCVSLHVNHDSVRTIFVCIPFSFTFRFSLWLRWQRSIEFCGQNKMLEMKSSWNIWWLFIS